MLIDVCMVPWFLSREPCGAPARHWFHVEAKGLVPPRKVVACCDRCASVYLTRHRYREISRQEAEIWEIQES